MIEEEFCDEEKSYHKWVAKNIDYISHNKQHVTVMKKLYMEGFAAGFQFKKELQSKEWLQK
jgi:hypothetical protein